MASASAPTAKALEGHVERGSYDAGLGDDVAHAGLRGAAGVRRRLRLPVRHPQADHRRHQRSGGRRRPGAGLLLRPALRRAGVKLTTSHGRLGLPAEYGLSWLLPRLIGLTRAADLLLSSRVVLAEEAEQLGLVNRVVAPEELMAHTYAYAGQLATRDRPSSLAATKLQIYRTSTATWRPRSATPAPRWPR